MTQRFTDNARTTLASFLSDSATSLSVAAGTGDLFPEAGATTPGGEDWFKVVLQDEAGEIEIVYVYTRAAGADLMADVVRAREGTAARSWASGETVVGLRMTAKDLEDAFTVVEFWDIPESNETGSGGNKTLIADDGGHHVEMDGGTVTVPAAVFAKGAVVVVVNNSDTARGLLQGSGVTLRWVDGATGNRVIRPWGLASVFCLSANVFIVTGQGVE
jgi:hypothetical protein